MKKREEKKRMRAKEIEKRGEGMCGKKRGD